MTATTTPKALPIPVGLVTSLIDMVLAAAFHAQLVAPDADSGIALMAEITRHDAVPASWHEAVARAVHDGYLYDPVRLSEGALQCHWRLELTPKGVAAARGRREVLC
jgi:hypothetical protein